MEKELGVGDVGAPSLSLIYSQSFLILFLIKSMTHYDHHLHVI